MHCFTYSTMGLLLLKLKLGSLSRIKSFAFFRRSLSGALASRTAILFAYLWLMPWCALLMWPPRAWGFSNVFRQWGHCVFLAFLGVFEIPFDFLLTFLGRDFCSFDATEPRHFCERLSTASIFDTGFKLDFYWVYGEEDVLSQAVVVSYCEPYVSGLQKLSLNSWAIGFSLNSWAIGSIFDTN